MDSFILRALIAIFTLSALVGPLGSVAIWRRMGYFGDAASHAALLGVAIALLWGLPIYVGTAGIAIILALYLAARPSETDPADGLLGVVAHGSLALAVVLISMSPTGRGNLEAYLFGDILTITRRDLMVFAIASAILLAVLYWRWQGLINATLNEEMAAAHGGDPRFEARIFTLLLALAVAMGIQIVGALLMGGFLVIPAMSARRIAKSPESMAFWAMLAAAFSGVFGLALAYQFDTPPAPSMVVVAVVVFLCTQLRKNANVN